MKKIFLLYLLTFLSIGTKLYAYDLCVDGIYYKVDLKELTAVVTSGDSNDAYNGEINIPLQMEYGGRIFIVKEIGEKAFKDCPITKVILPQSVNKIGAYAFGGCSQLNEVELSNVITIGENAFENCLSLQELTIPTSVTSIGSEAFKFSGLKKVIFEDCEEKITISEAFVETQLEYIYLGRDISYNSRYEEAIGPRNQKWVHKFYNRSGYYIKEFIIGKCVKELPPYLFESVDLDELIIPCNVTYIANYAFMGKYRKIVFEDGDTLKMHISSTTLGAMRPMDMDSLKYLYLGRKAFCIGGEFMPNIEVLVLGENMSCGGINFGGSPREVYVNKAVPPSYLYGYPNETYINGTLYVPKDCVEAYRNAEGWKNFFNIQESEYEVQNIEDIDEDIPIQQYISNNANEIQIVAKNGQIILSGIESNSNVSIYDINGIFIDTNTCIDNQIIFNTKIPQGNVVIVQIGEKMYKVLMN